MNYCIVYLASPLDGYNSILSTGEKRIVMMYMSLKNITSHLKLPVIIFHEDFTEKEMNNMRNIYSNIVFEKIDMIRNDLIFKQKPCKTSMLSDNKCLCKKNSNLNKNPKSICFRPKGYLMMCRFFSGEMQNHPSLQKYDGYIRFDDDSFLIKPFISQENFLNELKDKDYVFRSIFRESQDQKELFNFTIDYCNSKGMNIRNILTRCKSMGIIDKNNNYLGHSPYNNFHFSKLSLWKHPIISDYIHKLNEVGGCLKKGWMDANIHAMIIFVIMPEINLKVYGFYNFGYRHNRAFSIFGNYSLTSVENERFFPLIDISEVKNY
uniref:Uncharacterized protein n=1 Tax=viral metagenome TaxID=1070528 RepID=A0A6C0KE05_9ZZZZ